MYGNILLWDAYKIENQNLLKDFEDRLASTPNAVLKGLFSVIEFDQIFGIAAYGISGKKSRDFYKWKILRIPQTVLSTLSEET